MVNNSFHNVAGPFSLEILAKLVNGKIYDGSKNNDFGSDKYLIYGASDIDNAKKDHITFISIKKTIAKIKNSKALACIVDKYNPKYFPSNMVCLEVKDPHIAFATISQKFYPDMIVKPKISKNCEIADSCNLSDTVRIDSYTVIEDNVNIGKNVWIGNGCYIGKNVKINDNTRIMSNVTIECAEIGSNVLIYPGVRIGQRGFGFAPSKYGHIRVPQVGKVIINNNVEVGANSCIDRGSFGDTIIGEGTYIDNLVHVAHNVKIGKHCAIAGQVGIAGSAVIDDYCMFGGQVGIGGHIKIGKGVQAGGQAGITKNLKDGSKVSGTPAISLNDYHRQSILLKKIIKDKDKR